MHVIFLRKCYTSSQKYARRKRSWERRRSILIYMNWLNSGPWLFKAIMNLTKLSFTDDAIIHLVADTDDVDHIMMQIESKIVTEFTTTYSFYTGSIPQIPWKNPSRRNTFPLDPSVSCLCWTRRNEEHRPNGTFRNKQKGENLIKLHTATAAAY